MEKEREDEQITKPVLFEQEKERSTVGGADLWDTVVVGAGTRWLSAPVVVVGTVLVE
jgi:hypothetical protein